jgi:hypothetical protein
MRSKVVIALVLALAVVFCLSSAALAQDKGTQGGAKLLCVSKTQLKGENTVSSCLANGEEFAIIDQYGIAHVLTPREVEITKAFNPKIFEMRAYGLNLYRAAPSLPPGLPWLPQHQK